MEKLLGEYRNGNYNVRIYSDGTKVRYNDLDTLEPDTVESFDLKITNQCDRMCRFCHENSTPDGAEGDIINLKFLETLHPYAEIAIGGGNPLSHSQLIPFLKLCKERKFIPSMTVNQVHFEKDFELIKQLADEELIYGLGISLVRVTDEFIAKVQQIPNAVLHVINGILHEDELEKLKHQNLKILILGYKQVRRGKDLYEVASQDIEHNKAMLKDILPTMIDEGWFKVISFDNRALNQLDVRSILPQKLWDIFYMGDDGIDGALTSSTMFIDAVTGLFAVNSCSMERYPLMNTIEEMYNFLKEKNGNS